VPISQTGKSHQGAESKRFDILAGGLQIRMVQDFATFMSTYFPSHVLVESVDTTKVDN
jgi:hypothetical protein